MIDNLLSALWFFLPAGLANAAPVFAAKIPALKKFSLPLDAGKSWNGMRLLGENKTWRGLIAGIVMATLIIALQKYLYDHSGFFHGYSWLDYRPTVIWWLGPLFGMGALLADAVESFFKRQLNIKPGESWFPFDQIDYIIGGCLFAMPVAMLAFTQYVWVFIAWFGTHLVTVYLGYLLGIRDKPI